MKANKPNKQDVSSALRNLLRRLRGACFSNLGLKLLSLFFALCLWSYVLTSSPTITRDKTLSNVPITVSGQSVLSSRGLATITPQLGEASIVVRASQTAYASVTSENVRVELDLSSIRATGRQSVRLRGVTSYGSVVQVWPESVELSVENQDQRYVPVNVTVTSAPAVPMWVNVSRVNPAQISVTGPTSLVSTVSSAQVNLDLSTSVSSHSRAEPFVLLDAQGQVIDATLSRSTNSINVSVDIYPERVVPVLSDPLQAIVGDVPDGYEIVGITVSPTDVSVAADDTLLEGIEALSIEPVDVTGHTSQFSTITEIKAVKGVKHLSSEQVSVTVDIEETELTKRFSNITLQFLGLPSGLRVTCPTSRVDVKATGAYSSVRALARGDIQAIVNLADLTPGVHELPVALSVDNYPDLLAEATPATVTVRIME